MGERENSAGVRSESRIPEWCPDCGHHFVFWQEQNGRPVHMRMIPCAEFERLMKAKNEVAVSPESVPSTEWRSVNGG